MLLIWQLENIIIFSREKGSAREKQDNRINRYSIIYTKIYLLFWSQATKNFSYEERIETRSLWTRIR